MKLYELPCYDNCQSFYGKAHVIEIDGETLLQSYDTIVCKIDRDGHFRRLWSGYSMTTMRHINSFLRFCGIPGGGKKWWVSLEV